MPVVLTLPGSAPSGEGYLDTVNVYKRVDATSHTLLSSGPISSVSYTDITGALNDEYHITFSSSTLGVESLPSNVYRVGTPWMQDMGVILELQTTSTNPDVDQVAIYRRRYNATNAFRLGVVSLGTQYYSDPDGQPGDEYHTTFLDSVSLDESQPGPSVIADAEAGTVVVSGFMRDVRNKSVTLGPGPRDPIGPAPRVEVQLVWTKPHITPAANGQVVARTHYDTEVATNGTWSLPLVPNDLLLGIDSYYEFTFTDGRKYFKKVRSTNGLAQNFALLEDVRPIDLR